MGSVGVIVPARNRHEYIPTCLASIVSQTVAPARIVLVDDRSDPPLNEIAASFGVEYVRCIRGNGTSGAPARNAGLAVIDDCDFILPVDSDDLIEPEYIAKCLKAIDQHERIGVAYPTVCSFGAMTGIRKGTVSVGGLIRAHVLRQVGGFPETIGWDEQALSQIVDAIGFGSCYCDAVYYYRRHPEAISGNWWTIRRQYHDTVDKRADFLGVAYIGDNPNEFIELNEHVSSFWSFVPMRDMPQGVTVHVENILSSASDVCRLNRLFTVATPDFLLLTTGPVSTVEINRLLDMLQPEHDMVCLGEHEPYTVRDGQLHLAPWSQEDVDGFTIRCCLVSKDVYKKYRFAECDDWQRDFFRRVRRDGRIIKARWEPCHEESAVPTDCVAQTIMPRQWSVKTGIISSQ